MQAPDRFFLLGCAVEASLLVIAAGLNWIAGQPVLSDWHWNGRDIGIGAVGALPALGLFFWTLGSSRPALVRIREFLEGSVRPIFKRWSLWQLLVISLLAGLGEELLFRGALQGGLTRLLGVVPALALASLVFGCFHPMTWGYLWVTTAIGVYLGVLWVLTGNMLVPVVSHALYDFVALVCFLRWHR